jgi:hypothetical protein
VVKCSVKLLESCKRSSNPSSWALTKYFPLRRFPMYTKRRRMQSFLPLLFLCWVFVFGQDHSRLLDYQQLPPCARSCKILAVSELNCVPPAAPVSNYATYLDCLCKSDYLKSLHRTGVLCHDFCNGEDDAVIHEYYNVLCYRTSLKPKPTRVTETDSSSSAAPTTSTSSGALEPTDSLASPPKFVPDKPKDAAPWYLPQQLFRFLLILLTIHRLHSTGRYLIMAGVLIAIVLILIFGLAISCRRKHQKRIPNPAPDPIPLQVLSRLPNRDDEPAPAETARNTNHLLSESSFPSSLRFYQKGLREEAERGRRRKSSAADRTAASWLEESERPEVHRA